MLLLALLSLACAQMGEGGKPRRSRDGDMATSVEMECYQCLIEWDKDGYRMFYNVNTKRQIDECPLAKCDDEVRGGACAKVTWTQSSSFWEYRNCSSTFHNVCKDILRSPAEDCETQLHCTNDGCNGYLGEATEAPPPSRVVLVVPGSSGVRAAVGAVVLTSLWVFG